MVRKPRGWNGREGKEKYRQGYGWGMKNLSTPAASVVCAVLCCQLSRGIHDHHSLSVRLAVCTPSKLSLSRLSHDDQPTTFSPIAFLDVVWCAFASWPYPERDNNLTLFVFVFVSVCVWVFEFEYVHFERDWRLALAKFPSSAMDWTLHFLLIGLAVLILKRLLSYFFVVQNQLGLSVWNSCEIVNWMSHVQRTWFQEENFDNQLRVSVADSTNRHFLICNLRRSSWRLHCWSSTGSFGSCSSSALSQVSRISSIQRLAHLMASLRMSQTRLTLLCI
jgi:hypothetical protein